MNIGYDWGMVEGIMCHYCNTTYDQLIDMPVVKIFDYLEWGVYWMNMEAYFAMLRI